MTKCLVTDCGRPATSRGLCEACYKCAQIFVLKGRTTWKKLEDQGKCLPTTRRKSEELADFFVPSHKVAELEENELVNAIEQSKKDNSQESQDHVRGIVLDHLREMMETYGLTSTHTIGRLMAAIETTMRR